MYILEILIPGPWWHPLTYLSDVALPAGTRVKVPLGKAHRIGVTQSCHPQNRYKRAEGIILKKIISVLDPEPVISHQFIEAAMWTARSFCNSPGDILKAVLPAHFFDEITLKTYQIKENLQKHVDRSPKLIYDYSRSNRWDYYLSFLKKTRGNSLCLFHENSIAQDFFSFISSQGLEDHILLWHNVTASSLSKKWNLTVETPQTIIVGSPSAAGIQLPNPGVIILDEESNPCWYTQSSPHFSIRSFIAARSRFENIEFIMGGKAPSSRVYTGFKPEETAQIPNKNLIFVDVYNVPKYEIPGIKSPIPLSKRLIEESLNAINQGRTALWLLDRKGYTGELHCDDCGNSITCPKCSGAMKLLDQNSLICPTCRHKTALPDRCPTCKGMILTGNFPGLDSLVPIAQSLAGDKPVYLWEASNPSTQKEYQKRLKALSDGGIILGSRRALELLDKLRIDTVCWIDADAESRFPRYDAKAQAYFMTLESLCRGDYERKVILQSRRPAKGWQKGLRRGWAAFWEDQLSERAQYGFPPSTYMIEIESPKAISKKVLESLENQNLTVMEPDNTGRNFVLMEKSIKRTREALIPFFSISNSRTGFPKIKISID